jgi:hypothetical protein
MYHLLARSPAALKASLVAMVVMKRIICGNRIVMHMRVCALSAAVTFFNVQNADTDATRGNHLSETSGVVLGPTFQRNKQNFALETDTPMQISGVIAQFDRVAYRARFEAHPSLRGRTNHDRALAIDQKDGAVEKLLVTRQGDRELLAATRGRQQPAAGQIGYRDIDHINRTAMLEAVNFLRERGFQATAQDMINAQHRAKSFQS